MASERLFTITTKPGDWTGNRDDLVTLLRVRFGLTKSEIDVGLSADLVVLRSGVPKYAAEAMTIEIEKLGLSVALLPEATILHAELIEMDEDAQTPAQSGWEAIFPDLLITRDELPAVTVVGKTDEVPGKSPKQFEGARLVELISKSSGREPADMGGEDSTGKSHPRRNKKSRVRIALFVVLSIVLIAGTVALFVVFWVFGRVDGITTGVAPRNTSTHAPDEDVSINSVDIGQETTTNRGSVQRARRLFTEGRAACANREYRKCRDLMKEVIELDPKHPEAFNLYVYATGKLKADQNTVDIEEN